MTLILFSIILILMFLFLLYQNYEKNKRIKDLIYKLEELDGSLPCYAPCFICRITQKPCVGKKSCKIYKERG